MLKGIDNIVYMVGRSGHVQRRTVIANVVDSMNDLSASVLKMIRCSNTLAFRRSSSSSASYDKK